MAYCFDWEFGRGRRYGARQAILTHLKCAPVACPPRLARELLAAALRLEGKT